MFVTEDLETHRVSPDAHTRILIEDVALAICQKTNCLSADGMCGHRILAAEIVTAVTAHHIDLFDKAGNSDAVVLLRGVA